MHLKSLTLKGFKSFADKTVLNLEPGITAIVGPNGSGKSNISDAVLWVLGERNAKNLRGQAMEDVIFAGSSARKPTGIAEVSLVLDNSDHTVPVDFEEFVVTRRMYRSGENEYLINSSPVRRMDVIDLLHDSGLGTGTHSIISQGSLDSVLQSKPEDRRSLVEEAAGVLKHKQRLAKSDRKLERMANNVERVSDIVGEVERQLKPLERKAKRAITYEELSKQAHSARLSLAVDDLRKLQLSWDELLGREKAANEQLELKRGDVASAEEEARKLQDSIQRDREEISQVSRRYRQVSDISSSLQSVFDRISNRRRSANERANELAIQVEASKVRQTKQEEELSRHRVSLAEATAAMEASTNRIESLETELADSRKSLEQDSENLRELEKSKAQIERQIEELRLDHANSQEALTNGLAHIKVLDAHIEELKAQVAKSTSDLESLEESASTTEGTLGSLGEQEASAREVVANCIQARQHAMKALDEANASESAISAQIDALNKIEQSMADNAGEARVWLNSQEEEGDVSFSYLSHVIKASPDVEDLIELLAGSDMSCAIFDNEGALKDVASKVVSDDLAGELSMISDSGAHSFARSVGYEGTGRRLLDMIDYDQRYSNAVEALFGDVIVSDSLDEALAEHAKDDLALRFCVGTKAIVYPSGKVVVSPRLSNDEAGTLARLRNIEELKDSLKQAQDASSKARSDAQAAEESLRNAQRESLALTEKLADLRGTVQGIRREADSMRNRLSSLTGELETIKAQRLTSQEVIDKAKPAVEDFEATNSKLREELEGVDSRISALAEEASPKRAALQVLEEDLSQSRLEAAKLEEKMFYAKRMVSTFLDEIERLQRSSKESASAMRAKRMSFDRLEPISNLFSKLTESAALMASKLEAEVSNSQSVATDISEKLTSVRGAVQKAHEALDSQNEFISNLKVEKARMEMQVELAVKAITEDCHTSLESVLDMPQLESREDIEDELAQLNRRIGNLGTINPDAAQEYEALKERYDYLSGQLEDLLSASRSLRKINRIIESKIKESFLSTFQVVNENFKEIFQTLFPGGNAELILEDPQDIDATGIEVNAQPAGKRIAKMSLMSGGEKSLTALALLFALYKTRSTPFYILDEVEAALDDTNLARLVNFIDAMRGYTQLMMITHQRRTMETADTLFGVSMQADGVTKVISQKIEQAIRGEK